MKPAIVHKVTIYTGGKRWYGRFMEKPTREDVVAALQFEIDQHIKNLGKKCGDLETYVAPKREALEIMANAPSYFADGYQVHSIQVGATVTGMIKVRMCTVYVETGDHA